ncbi:Coiled-coil domain-containing protein [Schistosoma japonicum]|nr:Coiled-coil domain-containing protein [Schistosoma japonicum]
MDCQDTETKELTLLKEYKCEGTEYVGEKLEIKNQRHTTDEDTSENNLVVFLNSEEKISTNEKLEGSGVTQIDENSHGNEELLDGHVNENSLKMNLGGDVQTIEQGSDLNVMGYHGDKHGIYEDVDENEKGSVDGLNISITKASEVKGDNSTVSQFKAAENLESREELLEKYKQTINEQRIVKELNLQLQTKLAEYFRRKKVEAADQESTRSSISGSTGDPTIDYEQKYNKYLLNLADLHHQYKMMQVSYNQQIEELKSQCETQQAEVDKAYAEFMEFKYNIAKKSIFSHTRKPINPKVLTSIFTTEQNKEAIVREVRLENIKLKNELAKLEAQLKSKSELSEGLHLIDFEQLKIENQTYNAKIEERNEEICKLKHKISNTVQIMTHVKEKLQAVLEDNINQRKKLDDIETDLKLNRDQLAKMKQTKERLRTENARLRGSCGLLGKNDLLLNYEDVFDSVLNKRHSLEETKRTITNYQIETRGLARKIKNHQNNRTVL